VPAENCMARTSACRASCAIHAGPTGRGDHSRTPAAVQERLAACGARPIFIYLASIRWFLSILQGERTMTLRVRQLAAGALLLTTGIWFVGFGQAAGEKELKASIRKLADAIQKKDTKAAEAQTAALKKAFDDMEDLMNMMSGRNGDKG